MNNFQLRQFHFFKRESLEGLPEAFKKPELLLTSNGGDFIFLTDSEGYIHVVTRALIVHSFLATSGMPGTRITQIQHIRQSQMLLTVEENASASTTRPVIKLWPVDKLLRKAEVNPITVKYQPPTNTPYPLTAIAATPSLSQIALGFASGHICLIRGSILKSKTTKQRTIYTAPEPVTNLHYSIPDNSQSIQSILFATTTAQTLVMDTSNITSSKCEANVLEERGCGIGCSVVNPEHELVVARDEAIYFYTAEGRGPCFAFEAPKVMLRCFKHYLLLATAAPAAMAPTISTGDEATGASGADSPSGMYSYNDATTFTILDTKNKLVAYTGVAPGGVRGVATEWGSVFVLGGHGTLDHFSEKDLLEKLDILYRQNLYPLAVKLAQNGNYDLASVAGIYKKYGDWLYSKDEFDSAMAQYTLTIGYLEPSYVIRKYLDAQRLMNLASYLQELHTDGMATSDHTTLLLNCYTKLRDEDSLDRFIHTQEDFQFDVDTAIHVCRQAGFYSQALYLADKFSKTGMYLKLKIEDQEDVASALEYMKKLSDSEISVYLAEFGRRCLSALPRETTELLVDVCISAMNARSNSSSKNNNEAGDDISTLHQYYHPGNLLSMRKIQHLFADQPTWLAAFLESVIDRRTKNQNEKSSGNNSQATPYQIEDEEEKDEIKSAWNTLLELYLCGVESPLHKTNNTDDCRKDPKERALALLRDPVVSIDWERAYTLCASNNFAEGIAVLYEMRGDAASLLEQYIEQDDVEKMRELLSKHRDRQPELYVKALHYFAHSSNTDDNEALLKQCLETIEKHGLMTPRRVLQALSGGPKSESSSVTLGMVRDYIMRQIESTKHKIKDNEKSIDVYVSEFKKHHDKIESLQNKPVVFQSTKCSSCMAPLDLPSVHFLCRHSYHQRCLGDLSDTCPKCLAETQMLEDQRKRQELSAKQHDAFFAKLAKAEDGFNTIASEYSQSPFAFTKLVDQ